ncbi:hypothetical protein PBI_HARLEY_78 [Mycobacterium phage Harley]|uniref:Uncharacterized protein n=1 Tax=Mycobacterium phage Harley TaxID=2282909 RepID=A0A346FC15_9CAUD|nr:hypothetical protein I5H45_gp078 [Mycobacterium phage Harley]AXN53240.1 hypothetical protein PBI_HARLEY_78 [Mycobacterium phage Harley]
MNNPELRDVLTEALKAHQVYRFQRWDDDSIQWWQCHGCDFKSNTFPIKGMNRVVLGEEIAADHHADVIASLPGVAVIQLPEPDDDHGDGIAFWTAQEVGVADGMVVARFDPGNEAIYYEPSEAWETVAVLAAAAVVAEGEDK